MECNKCQGLMLVDYFPAMVGSAEQTSLCAWVCLDCGHAISPTSVATQTDQNILKEGSNTNSQGV
jgi:hypothetical protein